MGCMGVRSRDMAVITAGDDEGLGESHCRQMHGHLLGLG